MRIPPALKKGDTIGLVAPAFGAVTEPYRTRYETAVRKFEARGYRVKAAESCFLSDGLGISTKPEKAARDLVDFYLDDSIRALISVGGGELMNETVSCIDFAGLRGAPVKWFMGYSDNTGFIVPMAALCDVAGIYGPCAPGFGKVWEDPENDAFALLEGRISEVNGYPRFELPENGSLRRDDPLAPYVLTEPKRLKTFVPEKTETSGSRLRAAEPDETVLMQGTLMGGCLDVLVNLAGTDLDYLKAFNRTHGKVIWVLEACDLNPMGIRRAVWHLLHCGWLECASGFLIGRPMASFRQEMMGVDAYNAVTDVVGPLGVPVVMDADIGHVAPMMPLVIGADARVRVRGDDLRVRMDL